LEKQRPRLHVIGLKQLKISLKEFEMRLFTSSAATNHLSGNAYEVVRIHIDVRKNLLE